jgi:hypothetical protein
MHSFAFYYTTPASSPKYPNTWTGPSEKRQKLSKFHLKNVNRENDFFLRIIAEDP